MIELEALTVNGKDSPPHLDPAILAILREATIDLKKFIPKPPIALAIRQGLEESPTCTFGNFSLVTGKAKSRKTFLNSMLTAAALSGSDICDTFRSYLPVEKKGVLYFDTEQGAYHAQQAVRRAVKLSGQEDPQTFKAIRIKKYKADIRRNVVRAALELNKKGLGIVVLDGIADLIKSVNDEAESSELVDELMAWCENYDCHFACVIHENKGNSNTVRGHLGTILVNKAETVFRVEKVANNQEVSIVHAEATRDKPFKPFAIGFDEETKLPAVMHDFDVSSATKTVRKGKQQESKKGINQFTPSEHIEYLKEIFTYSEKQNGTDLKKNILDQYPNIGKEEVRLHAIKYLLTEGWILTNKANGVSNTDIRYWPSEKLKKELSIF